MPFLQVINDRFFWGSGEKRRYISFNICPKVIFTATKRPKNNFNSKPLISIKRCPFYYVSIMNAMFLCELIIHVMHFNISDICRFVGLVLCLKLIKSYVLKLVVFYFLNMFFLGLILCILYCYLFFYILISHRKL